MLLFTKDSIGFLQVFFFKIYLNNLVFIFNFFLISAMKNNFKHKNNN